MFSKPVRYSFPSKSYVRLASSKRPTDRFLRTPILYFVLPSPQSLQFHSSAAFSKGITPDAEDPSPKELPREPATQPTDITDDVYHDLSDRYLEGVVAKLEEMQESTQDLDVEFSVRASTHFDAHGYAC